MASPAPFQHAVYTRSEPRPGPPSRARVRAAVSRIVRHHARADDEIATVFGRYSVTANALETRVRALATAEVRDLAKPVSRLHAFAVWLVAACETIELEHYAAANLHVSLGVIIVECERIAGAGVSAFPASDEPDDESEEAGELDSAA